jgi:hypothetical protein
MILAMLLSEGADIIERLGRSFGLLPVPAGRWGCDYHRAQIDPKELEIRAREAYLERLPPALRATTPESMGAPPMMFLECETRSYWPPGVPLDATHGADFPQPTLPDDRWIVCVPTDPDLRPPSVRRVHWEEIVGAAKAARGPLLLHAYDVASGRLREWKEIGLATKKLLDDRDAIQKAGQVPDPNSYPFNVKIDWKLSSWVSKWANRLSDDPGQHFTPSVEALAILHRRLGVEPETIKTWMARGKRATRGNPAEGFRKNKRTGRKVQERPDKRT